MNTSSKALTIVVILVLAFTLLPTSLAATSNTLTYELTDKTDGIVSYRLYVSVPDNLITYYKGEFNLYKTSDFVKYVTPYPFIPMADRLWEIYNNQEDYANAVLRIVHQITYENCTPEKYPITTMIDGWGDCDLFSFIAASILVAGGFDVVLLYYPSEEHMNIGIHLSVAPKYVRNFSAVTSITDPEDGVIYYIGECTGGLLDSSGSSSFGGWRVGECDSSLEGVNATIFSLHNTQNISPGQVTASLNDLQSSTLSLGSIFNVVIQNGDYTLSGQISPVLQNQNVTLYMQDINSKWAELGTTNTASDGKFTYAWNPESAGFYSLIASWSGNDAYAGATSSTIYVIVVPWYLLAAAVLLFIGGLTGLIVWAVKRSKKPPSNPVVTSTPRANTESPTL